MRARAASVAADLRRCLGHFATGVTVVSYAAGDEPRGLTVNSFASVSLDPPLVLFCLGRRSRAMAWLPAAPFAVNILAVDQRPLADRFAGAADGPPPRWGWTDGVPWLDGCLASLTCVPWSCHEAGDHLVVVGRITDFVSADGAPLCFYRGRFGTLA